LELKAKSEKTKALKRAAGGKLKAYSSYYLDKYRTL
jgi:hypothetical protein